ncbi:hypothetical protein [Devosia sp.]|uniref:hypothetical protein n=1 Tax=Devosia sp. TaxID=1871048 RepID=UPI0032661DC1
MGAPSPAVAEGAPSTGDLALYQAIVEQMRAGRGYYPAAHDLMVANGYGTLSVFNWRMPLLMEAVSLLPSLLWAQVVLIGMAIGAAALAGRLCWNTGGWPLAGPVLALLVLGLAGCLPQNAILFAEIPAGVLILGSAALYGLGRPWWGAGVAALALLVRELAGIYVLVCIYRAARGRRFAELGFWLAVLLAYAGYFAWHYGQVQTHIGANDPGYSQGWLQWGGIGFWLTTASFNGVFLLLPVWVTALVLPLGVLGLLAWPGRNGAWLSLGVLAFLMFMGAVGKPFNAYWGALYTPMLTVGLGWAGFALRDLVVATRSGAR